MTIKAIDIIEETGISMRRLDYWVRHNVVPTITQPFTGSGYHREFDESVVDRVRLLIALSDGLNISRTDTLKQIYLAYEEGSVELITHGYILTLKWV